MYTTKFGFRHTATDAADSSIFAMRNPAISTKRILIRKIILTVNFDGTAAASRVGYGITRYTVADPTGGTSPARIGHDSSCTASVIADDNIKNGAVLTLTSAVYEGNFHEVLISSQPASGPLCQVIEFDPAFKLKAGEGLCIRLALVAVVGTGCSGSVWWDEVV